MPVQRFRTAPPLLAMATILTMTAVTSCSSTSTTTDTARAVSAKPAVTNTATRLTALGQGDADTLALRAKQYLNAVVKTANTTTKWEVGDARAASAASGQLTINGFNSPAHGLPPQHNQMMAKACGTTWSSEVAASHSTGSTFLTVTLNAYSSDPHVQIQEWDAVAPSAAVRVMTKIATSCGSVVLSQGLGGPVQFTSTAQPLQVLGNPAVGIQTGQTHGRDLWSTLVAFSGTRMMAVSSQGWNDGAPDKPPFTNDALTQMATALLQPSGG